MLKILLCFVVSLLSSGDCFAADQCGVVMSWNAQGVRTEKSWEHAVGERIVVEGFGWDGGKDISQEVVYSGGSIYVDVSKLPQKDPTKQGQLVQVPSGKLVQVVGILRKRRQQAISPVGPPSQGYAKPFDYFIIEVESFQTLDRLQTPYVVQHRK